MCPTTSQRSSSSRNFQQATRTLYRHFPTREHLLAEVYRYELTQLVDAVAPLLVEHSPLRALTCWMEWLVEYARVKRGVMAAIEASAWRDVHAGQHHRLDEALGALLDRGKAACQVRDDVDAVDVILLLGALSRIPESEWDARGAHDRGGHRRRPPPSLRARRRRPSALTTRRYGDRVAVHGLWLS
jgi:AcrR family transcriptional regulator